MNGIADPTTVFRAVKPQQGITLIEVLVTVVISAVGLLGIAVLQLTALKGVVDSSQRMTAAAIVSDIADRLRANPAGRQANEYAAAFAVYSECDADTPPPDNICSDYFSQGAKSKVESLACNGAELALFDAWELSCGHVNQDSNLSSPVDFLVTPTITVSCSDSDVGDAHTCSDHSNHEITISWMAIANSDSQNSMSESRSMTSTGSL